MARTKPIRRSYGAGEWGRNRVRVFPDPKTGLFQIEWRDNGAQAHKVAEAPRLETGEAAGGRVRRWLPRAGDRGQGGSRVRAAHPGGRFFDIYGEEVTPAKRGQSRLHDRAAMKMFLGCFGRDRKPATLSQRDWDRFIRERRAGRVGPSGKPVSDRMIERDLKFLLAVLNWAVKSRDERGELLLGSNPLKGLKTPTEKNPTRVMLTEEEYRVLLHVSLEMDWRFHVALVLAHETGHRIGAIRQLQWSDIDFEERVVLWRAEHDKSGYEHRTPVTAEALAALEEARKRNPVTGHTLVLPSPQDPSRCVGSCQARGWWQKAEGLARLEPKRGRGWHSLRRKFASDLMDQPLKVLCELGGWKEAKTVLHCYQRADEAQLRTALESRRRVRA